MIKHRLLGTTGLRVSSLALGALQFGAAGNPDHDDATRIIRAALAAGINVIDTADTYSRGESEEIVGEALAGGLRADVILATKFHHPMGDDPNHRGNSKRWIIREVEASLRRLRTDWIDLYQVHRPDEHTDIDETLGALSDLIHQGKIRYIGTSTFPAYELVEAQWVARDRIRERFVCEQPPYSMLVRGIESDVLPACERYGIGVMPWSPLAGGWLSGRYRKGLQPPASKNATRSPWRYDLGRPENQAKLAAVEALAVLAQESGLTLVHMALAFVLQHPAISATIIGPRTMAQLDTQLGAVDVTLTPDVLDRIDAIVPPGRNVNPAEAGYLAPSILDPARRRRALSVP